MDFCCKFTLQQWTGSLVSFNNNLFLIQSKLLQNNLNHFPSINEQILIELSVNLIEIGGRREPVSQLDYLHEI